MDSHAAILVIYNRDGVCLLQHCLSSAKSQLLELLIATTIPHIKSTGQLELGEVNKFKEWHVQGFMTPCLHLLIIGHHKLNQPLNFLSQVYHQFALALADPLTSVLRIPIDLNLTFLESCNSIWIDIQEQNEKLMTN